MSTALKQFIKGTKNTPQTVQARPDQVENNAGGFVFGVSDQSRLERFLIIGTDGGTYYVGEQDLTKQNVDFLIRMIAANERAVVDTVVDVSVNGRAYKQSPALFALALVLTLGKDKAYAREAFNKVVRTSTHLFEVAEYVDGLGGWGRSKRTAFANWYESKDADSLAYQAVKYRQRNGWTHRDVLRLSHAKPADQVARFMTGKELYSGGMELFESQVVPGVIHGFVEMQANGSVDAVLLTLDRYKNLPWETIPTQFLTDARVWKALFYNGQLKGQALVRNITRLAKLGAFKDMVFARDYANALTDAEMIAKTKLHPINFLNASVVYAEGQKGRGGNYYSLDRNKTWDTESVIADALTAGFHESFKHVEPANKRTLVGTDVSGSMSWSAANGLDLTAAQVSAAVAMTIAKTEPYCMVRGFADRFVDLGITANDNLSSAMQKVQKNNFGGTDCALPMRWARENKVEVDTFVVITDNETWQGPRQVFQELKKYRDTTGIPASLAVLGVSSTEFSIADKNDRRQLDMVGFDSAAPRVLADFSGGRL
jgi:60 kDa SS-A/Ro ribonucleoprotein